MICDKCGKNNKQSASHCTYCGAEMPKLSGSNGFADILSYKPAVPEPIEGRNDFVKFDAEAERMRALEMQKLNKKSDRIIDSTNKNTILALIAVILCGLILISSVVINFITMSKLNDLEDKISDIEVTEEVKDDKDDKDAEDKKKMKKQPVDKNNDEIIKDTPEEEKNNSNKDKKDKKTT